MMLNELNMKNYRDMLGISQMEIAKAAKMLQSDICLIEKGYKGFKPGQPEKITKYIIQKFEEVSEIINKELME